MNTNTTQIKNKDISIIIPKNLICELSQNPLTEDLYLISIKNYTESNLINNKSEDEESYSLIFCFAGKIRVHTSEDEIQIREKEYLICKTACIKEISHIKRRDNLVYIIQFNGKKAHCLIKEENTAFSFGLADDVTSVYLHKIQEIVHSLEMGYRKENIEYISGQLWTLLISTKYTELAASNMIYPDTDIITKAITIMKDHIEKRLTLEDLASELDYSPSHLSTLFTKKTGETPINYYNQLKIQQAATYLQRTNIQIKEIANRLQFYDEFYFSKVFKRYMGITPSKFKKKYSLIISD